MLLVTTALEETWGDKEDILFMGEWCKLYDRKECWLLRKHNVLPYHWNDRFKLKQNFEYLQSLNKNILTALTKQLNTIHSVKFSERYWNLILGYWLNLFTSVLFDRWEMIKLAENSGLVTNCFLLEYKHHDIVANDSSEFSNLIVDDIWNQVIYSDLIKNWTSIKYKIINEHQFTKSDNSNNILNLSFKRTFFYSAMKALSFFSRSNDAVIIKSYLPLNLELLLQLKIHQIPVIRNTARLKTFKFDYKVRDWILSYNKIKVDSFEHIVSKLISKYIPKAFLEGYSELKNYVHNSGWPEFPKFIFTANCHFSNTFFSMYIAEKTELGHKFITIDHGGFGINAFNGAVNYQIDISDKSISWGWNDSKHPKVEPFGIVKTIGRKQEWDPKGFGLLVQVAMPRYSFDLRSMPIGEQMINYFNDQYKFYAHLPGNIRKQFIIRLYHHDFGWSQQQRWLDNYPNVNVDSGKQSINKLIKKSRIIISTYNATNYLEMLSLKVPTIMFWNPNYWEQHERAIPYFNQLEKVGIFHRTPESAAQKVTEIWDDISKWWESKTTLSARKDFCTEFARDVKNPINELVKLLRSN